MDPKLPNDYRGALYKLSRTKADPNYVSLYAQELKKKRELKEDHKDLEKIRFTCKIQRVREYQIILWTECSKYFPDLDFGFAIDGWNDLMDQMTEDEKVYTPLAHHLYVDKGRASE